MKISIIIPTYNELENIEPLLHKISSLSSVYDTELLVIDDDSPDGTAEKVMSLFNEIDNIRLIRRIGRSGLSSAIKEGILNSSGQIAVVMDGDGQHDPKSLNLIIDKIITQKLDIAIGSRFKQESYLSGLSSNRKKGSNIANNCARHTLSTNYSHLTDYMSGFFALNLSVTIPFVRRVDVNGFKFLYEILAISKGCLNIAEIPLTFTHRIYGSSKLDLAIFWDFLISLIHSFTLRLIPRRAISFALVGATGVLVQLITTSLLMSFLQMSFLQSLPFAIITAATSNYLVNNILTFRFRRLYGIALLKGLLKFLIVASLPVIANIGLATAFYEYVSNDTTLAQLAGIILVFVWNYAASSALVWNTPK